MLHIISMNEDGMCVNLSLLSDAVKKQMKLFEQDVDRVPRAVFPEFFENLGWVLHNSVDPIPLTKYCMLQEIYITVNNMMHINLEVPLCEIMKDFDKDQLEVVLPIIFNS